MFLLRWTVCGHWRRAVYVSYKRQGMSLYDYHYLFKIILRITESSPDYIII